MKQLCVTVLASLIAFSSVHASNGNGEAKAMLRKAREYLGSELKLDRVESLYYKGKIEEFSNGSENVARTGDITIYFAKPLKQRLEISYPEAVRITVINDYEGFTEISKGKNKRRFYLDGAVIRNLQANTRENLNFFSLEEDLRRKIIDGGREEFLGQQCHKVIVEYSDGNTYTRYFNPETGKLVATLANDGRYLVETGSIVIDGIRFPQVLETYSSDHKLEHRVTFEEIAVNELPEGKLFALPSMF